MIKGNIESAYTNQYSLINKFVDSIYVTDYTEQTKVLTVKRSVEFFSPTPPLDITYFSILNTLKLPVDGIKFDNSSFVCGNGLPKSQCEAVFFPSVSSSDSWILFCELKYSSKPAKNTNNLKKAISQLYKTHYYYIQASVITLTNSCYLVASLPLQSEPFANFSVPPALLTKLKRTRNIILRLKNSVEIIDSKILAI